MATKSKIDAVRAWAEDPVNHFDRKVIPVNNPLHVVALDPPPIDLVFSVTRGAASVPVRQLALLPKMKTPPTADLVSLVCERFGFRGGFADWYVEVNPEGPVIVIMQEMGPDECRP